MRLLAGDFQSNMTLLLAFTSFVHTRNRSLRPSLYPIFLYIDL